MNNPKILVARLEELIDLAAIADDGFKKAAIYAAATTINQTLYNDATNHGAYILECIDKVCWHICASIGYDTSNSMDADAHVKDAKLEIRKLTDTF